MQSTMKERGVSLMVKFGRLKRGAALALLAVMVSAGSLTAYGAGWHQDGLGWWYEQPDGTYPVNTWYEDTDGSWYFFNEQGYMISNCYRVIDGNVYAFGSSGEWSGTMFSDIYPGVWAGNSFGNEWSGFHINVPEGYEIVTAPQTGAIGSSKTLVEFVVRTPDGTGSGMELEYADAYDFPNGLSTTAEYIVSMHSLTLALSGYTIEEVSAVTLGGKEYLKLTADGAGMVKRDFYCRKVGEHYFECISVIYWMASQPAMDNLVAGMN